MAEASRSLETSAAPETVWRAWSDTATWSRWNPDIKSVNLQGPFANGTAGTMETVSGGRHNIALSQVEPNRGFTLTSDMPIPATKLAFRCAIEPIGAGSRISQGVAISGLFSLMGGPILKRVTPTFEPLLAGLKQYVEAA